MLTRKLRPAALAALAGLLAAPGIALAAPAAAPPMPAMTLGQAVALVKTAFAGEVIAAELDASGDKGAHYHVDLRLAHGATVKLEVDAATQRIAARAEDYALPAGAMTLTEAIAYVSSVLPGEVTMAVLDASGGTPAHYHVDVRLQSGKIARLSVDARTRAFAWRNVPTLQD